MWEKVAFIDSGRSKEHRVLTVGGDGKYRVRSRSSLSGLVKLGYKAGFVDSIFPTMYDDLRRLLEGGVEVYRLKRLALIPTFRRLNGFRKSDKNDARVLKAIHDDTIAKFGDVRRRFREVRLEEIQLADLIHRYRTLRRIRQKLLNANSTVGLASVKLASKAFKKESEELGEQIVKYAVEKLHGFKEFLEALTEELQRSTKKQVASDKFLKVELAELYALLDETRGFHPTRRYFGLYRKTDEKQYSGKMRKSLDNLSMAYASTLGLKRIVFDAKWRQQLLWTIWRLKRQTVNPERQRVGIPDKEPCPVAEI